MAVKGAVRGAYSKTAARRSEILHAGIEVFSSGGYRSGTIREIAERVGMSQAGLLHHFSNKHELLAGVLSLRDEISRETIGIEQASGRETILGMVELVDYNTTVAGLVQLHCVLSAEATAPEHPAHQYFVDRYRSVIATIQHGFEGMRAEGELVDGVDPATAARAMVALMDGLQVQWLLDPEAVDMAEEVRRYLRPLMTRPV
jgi:AcrR family transcriptional regulator